MIATIIWALGAVGIFLWNAYKVPYIGIRFTEPPISGAWLCVAVATYCLIRFFVRRRKGDQNQPG
jgi:hypothetical protein